MELKTLEEYQIDLRQKLSKISKLENVEKLALAFAQFDVTQTESIDKLGCPQTNLFTF